jgi:hypothetical protein
VQDSFWLASIFLRSFCFTLCRGRLLDLSVCVCVCLILPFIKLHLALVLPFSSYFIGLLLFSFLCVPRIILGKDDGPAPSISGRPKESRHDITPAPVSFWFFLLFVYLFLVAISKNVLTWQGDYNPEKGGKFVGESSPSFTFGAKVKDERKDNLPGRTMLTYT